VSLQKRPVSDLGGISNHHGPANWRYWQSLDGFVCPIDEAGDLQ
jgi:hypothetical protein